MAFRAKETVFFIEAFSNPAVFVLWAIVLFNTIGVVALIVAFIADEIPRAHQVVLAFPLKTHLLFAFVTHIAEFSVFASVISAVISYTFMFIVTGEPSLRDTVFLFLAVCTNKLVSRNTKSPDTLDRIGIGFPSTHIPGKRIFFIRDFAERTVALSCFVAEIVTETINIFFAVISPSSWWRRWRKWSIGSSIFRVLCCGQLSKDLFSCHFNSVIISWDLSELFPLDLFHSHFKGFIKVMCNLSFTFMVNFIL